MRLRVQNGNGEQFLTVISSFDLTFIKGGCGTIFRNSNTDRAGHLLFFRLKRLNIFNQKPQVLSSQNGLLLGKDQKRPASSKKRLMEKRIKIEIFIKKKRAQL